VFAGLTGKGLSYLSASETAALISAPSCLPIHHPPCFSGALSLCNLRPEHTTLSSHFLFNLPNQPPSLARRASSRTSRHH